VIEFVPTDLEGVRLVKPAVFSDPRGFFLECYTRRDFEQNGIACTFVQDNHSRSATAGILRGLHFQCPPFAQAKLVRVIRGAVFDVVVDIRRSSSTYGAWQSFTLSAGDFTMLFVPQGFAHGFCTTEPDTEVQYKVDNYYSRQHERGILWNDPTLAIGWPVARPVLSEKDRKLPTFDRIESPF
jgi:dTDP-4-dehydrorhamnose 3,5-epimerase